MKHGSLFSGIGGFDLAAEWIGWTNKFHCEWKHFGKKILKHDWPECESYSDISKTDFTIWRGKIDVLTGGFPCQPYSYAGKRLGKEDDRHLWPEMLRAIREIQPRYVVGENVSGLVNWNGGLVFEEIQADMEAEGYEVTPFLLPAAGVGAPHRRDRIWFVAYSHRQGSQTWEQNGRREDSEENRTGMDNRFERLSGKWDATDTERIRMERDRSYREQKSLSPPKQRIFGCDNSGDYWKDFPTQSPVCTGDDGFPTESLRQRIREDSLGLLSEKEIDKILSKAATEWRNESIKAAGNAIVPQVAYQIFQAIEQFQQLENG